jgi:hypothetical protein
VKALLLLLIFVLQGCALYHSTPEYIQLLNKTDAKFNKFVAENYQLRLCGYGGALMDDISGVSLHYHSSKKYDVAASRRLVVTCVEKLRSMINADEKLRPFLHEYPFPASRIKLSISVRNPCGHRAADSPVAYVSLQGGYIYYDRYNLATGHLEDICKEDYADALRIVSEELGCDEMNKTPQTTEIQEK